MAGSLAEYLADPNLRRTLPAGMRNNNPGNIKFVGQRVPGIVGPSVNTDQGDPQAVFDTPESGMAAMYRLLSKKYAGGKTTPEAIIAGNNGWTPGNYQAAANVARTMGISPGDDIGMSDPQRAASFMRALILQEHGQKGNLYTPDMINSAVGMAGVPAPVQFADASKPSPARTLTAASPSTAASTPPHVMGSMAPQQDAQAQDIPQAVKSAAGMPRSPVGAASNLMAILGSMAPEEPKFSPVQIAGPSSDQATALASLVEALKSRMV